MGSQYYSYRKGATGVSSGNLLEQITSATSSVTASEVELRVLTTNVGAAAGVQVKDVILAMRNIERYLLMASPQTYAQQFDPVYPGQY